MHRTHNALHIWVDELERTTARCSGKSDLIASERFLRHWQRAARRARWRAARPWLLIVVLLGGLLAARLAWGQPWPKPISRAERGSLAMSRQKGLAVGPCVRLDQDEGYTCTFEMRTLLSAREGIACSCRARRSLGQARLVCECVTPKARRVRGVRGKGSGVSHRRGNGGPRGAKRVRVGVPRALQRCDIPGECG